MTKRCRHNGTWLIGGGAYEWCYECGALRAMRETGIASCTPTTHWCRPVGVKGKNPWSLWRATWATDSDRHGEGRE